ncbi:putative FAD-linked oxidoreductase [Ephemeroptericola cinctiostellae]|uniref:Putative FAD-linked oxidoreductase n=1 Tax=Ephemeroptericola cinctiostellae TaxID=2268024 RepID=A0A345DB84_9BURK|nr:FAD-binding oxidoreductase [Ephemeroptericola cinctiostellae]AXF85622.1 putative FAD-linked oxidoreductase [Ephemeroptericola cinctiostellae]
MSLNSHNDRFIHDLTLIVGAAHVRTGESAQAFHTDERNRYHQAPLAVVLPSSIEEVAQLVRLCSAQQPPIAVIPQGGNTGVVGGCAVLTERTSILLNLSRLNRIIAIDPTNRTLTAQAGVTLEMVQQAASAHGLIFPLTLASQSSATIGGNLATNAGGTQVLCYGTMRDLCLGLEVVLPSGDIWQNLNTLRKNNTGYDLKHLFIGAEGTLGLITAAVLKLFPAPKETQVALISATDVTGIVNSFDALQRQFDSQLTAFEYITPAALKLVCAQFGWDLPFPDENSHIALVEISSATSHAQLETVLHTQLSLLIEHATLTNALLAQNLNQAAHFWRLRENISAAQKRVGQNVKHDISVPISSISAFVDSTYSALEQAHPGIESIVFGHIGDGNLHFNVSRGHAFSDAEALMAHESNINAIVYKQVAHFNGSISAEHGIGLLKRDLMINIKSPVELMLMQQIKQTLDPLNIMNPNKVIPNTIISLEG